MKRIIGLLLIVIAIAGGLYFGGWICFCKAIVDIIVAIKGELVALDIGIALFKIFICLPIIEFVAYSLLISGTAMIAID